MASTVGQDSLSRGATLLSGRGYRLHYFSTRKYGFILVAALTRTGHKICSLFVTLDAVKVEERKAVRAGRGTEDVRPSTKSEPTFGTHSKLIWAPIFDMILEKKAHSQLKIRSFLTIGKRGKLII
jgi:hypothetical protein